MIHTLIIWNKGLDQKEFILNDIDTNFNILNVFNINWNKSYFHSNLKRFYSHSQFFRTLSSFNKIISKKIKHCGDGNFILVVFEDKNPQLTKRETTSGTSTVNTNVFDRKASYRKRTGGGHKIHSSDNAFETNKDLVLLFGQTTAEFVKHNAKREEKEIKTTRNITGVPFWKDVTELFTVLNNSIDYVVLRNFECLPDAYNVKGHGDIDVLVENLNYMTYLTGAKNMSPKQAYRCNYSININNEQVPFDFRFLGDNYYDVEWEKEILASKELIKNTFYAPNTKHHFYSLLYHAVIHKPKIGKDYIKKLKEIDTNLFSNFKELDSEKEYSIALSHFLESQNYNFTTPLDTSVFINSKNTCYTNYGEASYNKYKNFVSQSIIDFNNTKISTQVFRYNGVYIKKANQPVINNENTYLSALSNSTFFPKVIKTIESKLDAEIYISEITGLLLSDVKSTPKFWKKRHVINAVKSTLDILIDLTQNNVLHRDIRPENIILEKQNKLYTSILFDFGWATSIDNSNQNFPEGLGYKHKYKEGQFSDAYSIAKCLETEFPKFNFINTISKPLLTINPESYKNRAAVLSKLKELKETSNTFKFSFTDTILLAHMRIKSWGKQLLK